MERMEYTVVKISGQLGREATFIRETTTRLNDLAGQGWRLIAVDQFWAYLERPLETGPKAQR